MSKLSEALKRLKGKPKEKKEPQPAPKSSEPAQRAVPQPVPVATVIAPKATPQPPPATIVAAPTIQPSPLPNVTAPKTIPPHTPQATRQASKLAKSASKPAIQRHEGLYSGFAPDVAAIDQPTPKLVYGAKQTASAVLFGAVLERPSTAFTDFTNTRNPYARPDDYLDLLPTSSYSSYARPSRHAPEKPLGTFHTGGPVGGGLYPSIGGAIGGETISQTIGSLGEGSVSQTGGRLGEAVGVRSLVQSPGSVRPPMAPPQLLRPLAPPDTAETIPSPSLILDQIIAIDRKYSALAQRPSTFDNDGLLTLKGCTNSVESEAFSSDSKQLASASRDKTVRLWDATTHKLLQTLKGHKDWVTSVAFSSDGKQLASVSAAVRLWDATTGKLLQTLEGTGLAETVAFSSDGKQLALDWGNTIQLWDITTGELLQTLKGHKDRVTSIAFSSNGK